MSGIKARRVPVPAGFDPNAYAKFVIGAPRDRVGQRSRQVLRTPRARIHFPRRIPLRMLDDPRAIRASLRSPHGA